jgi:hypothetical protein
MEEHAGLEERGFALPDRLDAVGHRRAMERHYLTAVAGRPDANGRTAAKHTGDYGANVIRHLHEMVEDGILLRHDQRSVPPNVSYSISPYGMTLAPVLEKICEWGRKHQSRLERDARASGRVED